MDEDQKKIVVADDNKELCDVLKEILEGEGYKVDCVHDGFSLISYLKKVQDIDVVILDLIMPVKGGISVFDTVRSVSPASKLVIYTAYLDYKNSIFAKKADAFISKTEDVEGLINTIHELME
ncbi:MAG: response regulator [Candidatus Omnitrophota bacterium]